MKKQEILKVVKSMLVDWQDSEKFRTEELIESNHTSDGFCFWLTSNGFNKDDRKMIVRELFKDLPGFFKKLFTDKNWLWYPACKNGFMLHDYHFGKTVFTNRIEHLQRTIKRLETEIANEA